jgi:N-methylhydantoinase A/oxoprolinase/acetone carboxylase beta subunit
MMTPRFSGQTRKLRSVALSPRRRCAFPALIEEAASVTVVEPGQHLTVDRFGHLVIGAACL